MCRDDISKPDDSAPGPLAGSGSHVHTLDCNRHAAGVNSVKLNRDLKLELDPPGNHTMVTRIVKV